jgi:hypothetical protein
MTMMPKVINADEYSTTWWSWWYSVQPSWRDGPALISDPPEDAEWLPLMEGGPLGIGLVVMAVAWWVKEVGHDEGMVTKTRLADAIVDLAWVLDQLTSTLLEYDNYDVPGSTIEDPKAKAAPVQSGSKRRLSPLPNENQISKR